jgi:hypothetical protein
MESYEQGGQAYQPLYESMKNHKISNLKKNIHMDIALKPKRLNIG